MSSPKSLRRLGVSLTLLSALAAAMALTATAGPSKGNAAAGKAIFATKCVACHKADGSGGVKLTGNPTPSWKDKKRMSDPKLNDDYLRDCITNGKIKSGMVAWGKTGQVKPHQVEDLIAHIRVLAK